MEMLMEKDGFGQHKEEMLVTVQNGAKYALTQHVIKTSDP